MSVAPPSATGPLDLNSAGIGGLAALPGVGPSLAQRIVAYREAHGPFRSVDDLSAVAGVTPELLETLRAHAYATADIPGSAAPAPEEPAPAAASEPVDARPAAGAAMPPETPAPADALPPAPEVEAPSEGEPDERRAIAPPPASAGALEAGAGTGRAIRLGPPPQPASSEDVIHLGPPEGAAEPAPQQKEPFEDDLSGSEGAPEDTPQAAPAEDGPAPTAAAREEPPPPADARPMASAAAAGAAAVHPAIAEAPAAMGPVAAPRVEAAPLGAEAVRDRADVRERERPERRGFWGGLGLALLGAVLGSLLTLLGVFLVLGSGIVVSRPEFDALSRNVGTVQANAEMIWAQAADMNATTDALREELAAFGGNLDALEANLAAVEADTGEAVGALQEEVTATRGAVDDVRAALDDASARVARHDAFFSALSEALAAVEAAPAP